MQEIISNLVFPNPAILFGLALLVLLDLITGIVKSKRKGIATASQGMKKSVQKLTTYLSLITLSLILSNLAKITYDLENHLNELNLGINAVCFWLVHLEVKSVLENLIIANTDEDGNQNEVAKLLIPIHNAWILKFKNISEFSYVETKKDLEKKIKA
ncbi:Bacteriophage holin family protein [Paenimyroides ummariense]|uniref:Bacteriophage holin family protein n=1 Tax=Paenimyroides ummariense TaxID=913024 RepID=A0A1I5DZ31_9FLAO|nr:phage holin family protein [Paenimyroides ummariense]SFO04525.1 Bacteriophage holin family protein [Paenimyroides ummariense]